MLFRSSTHGLSRVESYGERLLIKGINPDAKITLERLAPAMVKVDGDNGVGPLVGLRALEAAMEVAGECGIGIAFARGSNHFGPISPYSLMAAEAGFASIIGSNATTCPAACSAFASALSRMQAPQYQPPVPGVRKTIFSGVVILPVLPGSRTRFPQRRR